MISINATLIVQIIHFLILVFILNRLMIQPIMKLIADRNEYIEKTKKEITDLEDEAEQLKGEFEKFQSAARVEAFETRKELREQAMGQVDEYLRDSQEKVVSIRSLAESNAEEEIEKNRPLLKGEAQVLADEIIQRVIGRRITA